MLNALKDFGGTVIFVSHDRGFIEQLANVVLELKPGEYKYFPGDYVYYLEQTGVLENGSSNYETAKPSVSSDDINAKNENSCTAKEQNVSETKLSWEEQKKRDSERRKIEKKIQKLESDIELLENKKSELEEQLANPAVYSNGEKAKSVQRDIENLTQQIEQITLEWEQASEELI